MHAEWSKHGLEIAGSVAGVLEVGYWDHQPLRFRPLVSVYLALAAHLMLLASELVNKVAQILYLFVDAWR